MRQLLFQAVVLLTCAVHLSNPEPVSVVIGVSMATFAAIGMLYKPLYCRLKECCEQPRWVRPKISNLKVSLEANVYGQHLVVSSVVNSLSGHLRFPSPKALVFSFQGWTGTGKNLVAKLIAEAMFTEGMKSQYVHVLSATKHFDRHKLAADYKDQIRDWVIGNVSACPYQLFIFDEVEKMPDGVLDVLRPFVDHYNVLEGVDYRKVVYVLLGNAGGKVLFDKTYEHYLEGKKRETLELKDIESTLWKQAYYEKGGLKDSSLISSDLISVYVPFLPLEKHHVRQCVINDLESKNFTKVTRPQKFTKMVDKVMDQLAYTPETRVYSISGCKRVHEKVNYVLEEEIDMSYW